MRRIVIGLCLAAMLVPGPGRADDPPVPELGFATGGTPGTCVRRYPGADPVTGQTWNPYGDSCSRLRFALGPIVVQPGQNSTYPYVVNIEKPAYDGVMTRIRPNLVLADGSVPPVDLLHIHHATWLSAPEYGNGPFFASGEEKTIAEFPYGYGMPVKRSDVWYMVHMVHGATPTPYTVWITYEIDFIPAAAAATLGIADPVTTESWTGIRTIKPFWLDVWKNGRRANYPVFNMQRGYGSPITDPVTQDLLTKPDGGQWSTRECAWPDQECASHDSWGVTDIGQGLPGNGKGTDIAATANTWGTLVGIGGHLHPGGLRVEVDMVRCLDEMGAEVAPVGNGISTWQGKQCAPSATEDIRRVFTSDAVYFDRDGRRPLSWDFSMTVAGLPYWKVNLPRTAMLRIRSIHETEMASWYEGMGIAVAYVWPGTLAGVDAFDPATRIVNDLSAEACRSQIASMSSFPKDADGNPLICARGNITHGPLPEAGRLGDRNITPWQPARELPVTDTIHMAGFLYEPGDTGTWTSVGIPTVKRTAPLTFVNEDAAANIFHTVTGCAYPCNGLYTLSYPRADFGAGSPALAGGGHVQFDSANLGIVPDPLGIGPSKGTIAWSMVPAEFGLNAGDIATYFCRVHPSMRGAFKVVE
ncbi:MAG TPA: hypothetical protein VM600_04215 [Actinomycetota bacterium]|nr:hypothetical protein [Actinomycetota bacterium]